MAISPVQQKSGTAGGTLVLTFGSTVTAGNLIVVFVAHLNSTRTITPSDNGLNTGWQTAIGPVSHSVSAIRGYIFFRLAGAADFTSITLTPSSGAATMQGFAIELSATNGWAAGAASKDQTGQGEDASTTSHDITGTMATTAASEAIIGGCFASGATTFSAGASFNVIDAVRAQSIGEYRIVSSTGNYSTPSTSSGSPAGALTLAATFMEATTGRTTKNTRSNPLGVRAGMGFRIAGAISAPERMAA